MPNQQPEVDPLSHVLQRHGSLTNFYRHVANQTGTTPDKVMEETEKMAGLAQNPNQPQSTLGGANAQTPVSQVASTTPPANPAAVGAQNQQLQAGGMAPSQAMNQAATNPANQMGMAKGGATESKPKHKPVQAPQTPMPQGQLPSASQVQAAMSAMGDSGTRAVTPLKNQPVGRDDPADNTPQYGGYAKGGDVHSKMSELKLKDILQLLASHPGVSGESSPTAQAGSTGFAGGGPVFPNSVSSDPMSVNKGGLMKMASGGATQEEEDQITGYGPDGQPIVKNADGTTGYGDLNQFLGRPEGSSTLGTGADPSNNVSKNAANTPLIGMAMSKGGADEAPPPGSLPHEIADDVPASLSEGEFVMSADTTRFYGLQKLHAMQDFARQELAKMEQSGGIRSPGDGQNPGDKTGFQQPTQPNTDFYGDDEQGEGEEPEGDEGMAKGGNVKDCNGGLMARAGGDIAKQDYRFSSGADSDSDTTPYKKGGLATKKRSPQHLDKGGVVSSKQTNLSPDRMKSANAVPTDSLKTSTATKRVNGPHVNVAAYGSKKYQLKANKGGLMRSVSNPFEVND